LPQHHHLFSGFGCFNSDSIDNVLGGKDCPGADALPGEYVPLLDCSVNKKKKEGTGRMHWECKPDSRAVIPRGFKGEL
jgi:hypothetical protein